MKIEWLPKAERNRETQLAYVAEHSPSAAIAMGDAIQRAVARLSEHPMSARLGRVQGTRELAVAGTPYVIVFRVERNAVAILRVLHGKQRWPVERDGIVG